MQINRSALSELRNRIGRKLRSFDDPKFSKPAIAAMRDSVRGEFRGRYWATPSGGKQRWAPVVPFGNKPAHAPLVDSGAYFNALMGTGAGAIQRVSGRRIEIGADGSRFPQAAMLRGGTGAMIRLTPTIIRPKKKARGSHTGARQWALFWFLGLTYGVWLREETIRKGLRVPPRPHLTRSPQLTKVLVEIALKFISQR